MTTRTMKMLLDAIEEQRKNPDACCYVLDSKNLDNVEHFLRSFDYEGLLPVKGSRAALRAENEELRGERVLLQAENESLRNDLARMPAGGPALDDRDRELLHYAAQFVRSPEPEQAQAAYRLLCRLAQQPVEEDERARMEDEGGPATPAEPNRAGWHGTWVAEEKRDTYGPGSRVRLKEGTKSHGGAVLNVEHEWHVLNTDPRAISGHTVFIGVKGSVGHGFWVNKDDIAEVLK